MEDEVTPKGPDGVGLFHETFGLSLRQDLITHI